MLVTPPSEIQTDETWQIFPISDPYALSCQLNTNAPSGAIFLYTGSDSSTYGFVNGTFYQVK